MRGQILVEIDDDTHAKLEGVARRRGRSTEAHAREILCEALAGVDDLSDRLGTRIAARFAKEGLTEDIPELRSPLTPATFKQRSR